MSLVAAAGPSAYWYLTRATGAVSMVLLSASVVLGILGSLRFAAGSRWPRFTIDTLHRDISLLVLAVLAVHILTSVLDSFAPIGLADAVIPLSSAYRPLWVGLGALSFDLLLALAITSLLRRRLGYRRWRAVHWLAYVSWPVAILHGLGTGSDTKLWWMLALTAACVAAVVLAVLARLRAAGQLEPLADVRAGAGAQRARALRAPAAASTFAVVIGIAVFTLAGPLQRGWARKAGTPAKLLAGHAASRRPSSSRSAAAPRVPFAAKLAGRVTQTNLPAGALVDLSLRLSGGATGRLRIRLAGAPLGQGGLSLAGSQVDLLADGAPSVFQGRVTSLQGEVLDAKVTDVGGRTVHLHAVLHIDQSSGGVVGTLRAST